MGRNLGEPLNRLQIGVNTSNPFQTYMVGNDAGYYSGSSDSDTTEPEKTINVDADINNLAHKAMSKLAVFSASKLPNVTFKADHTYGPTVTPGANLWVTTSNSWTKEGSEGTIFTIENGKVASDLDDALEAIHGGLTGSLEYYDFVESVNNLASTVNDGHVVFGVAAREEEAGALGTKIIFQNEIKKGDQTVEIEISLEIYLKQVPGSPVVYPTIDFNKVKKVIYTVAGFAAVGLFIAALPEEAAGAAVRAVGVGLISVVTKIADWIS